MDIKKISRKIHEDSKEGDKFKNVWRFKKDVAALKYLKRAESRNFVFTRRTISELSPWTIKMVRAILNKKVTDIKSGLEEILRRETTLEETFLAFSVSPIYERLAEINYTKKREFIK
jgi:hypothetical protein